MFLLLSLFLLTTVAAQIEPEPVDGPGVCYELQKIPYIEYETRWIGGTRRAWCWDIKSAFRCEVPFGRYESVPVTKERDATVRVCCAGYAQDENGNCIQTPIEQPELERVEQEPANEDLITVKEVASAPSEDVKLEDLELAKELFKASHVTSRPSEPAEPHPIAQEPPIHAQAPDHHENHAAEAMALEMLGIVAKEFLKSLDTPTTAAPQVAPPAPAEAPALLWPLFQDRSDEKNTEADSEESEKDPAEEPEANEQAQKELPNEQENHQEVPAEDLTSESDSESGHPNQEISSPSVEAEQESEPLSSSLTAAEEALLETMADLSKAHVRAISRLHYAFTLLRRHSPTRAAFD